MFRGGSTPQQPADKDQPPFAVAQSAESGASASRAAVPADDVLLSTRDDELSAVASETSRNTVTEPGLALDPATVYAKSRIAVATISTKDSEDFDVGQGSGFFIAAAQVGQLVPPRHLDAVKGDAKAPRHGYLLTNYHVIRAAASAKIRMEDSGVQLQGNSYDVVMEREDLDLALLSVSLWPPTKPGSFDGFDSFDWAAASKIPWWLSGLPTLEIADGEDPVVGTKVYAIGSPQGLNATLSEGIVSGHRAGSEPIPRLQFTAPVSPGSSGGPLLDSAGRVVGVVTALRRGGQNLNFAVPASEIRGFSQRAM